MRPIILINLVIGRTYLGTNGRRLTGKLRQYYNPINAKVSEYEMACVHVCVSYILAKAVGRNLVRTFLEYNT